MRIAGNLPVFGIICLLLFGADAARGAVVTLKNSDRLTGTIQKIEKRRIYLKTDYAGVVAINWEKVESVVSDQNYTIETKSGLRLDGNIRFSDGKWQVAHGEKREILTEPAIVSMHPVSGREEEKKGFLHALQGSAEAGFSLARGNSNLNQYSLAVNGGYRTETYNIKTSISSLFSRQTDAPTTSQHFGSVRYDRYVNPSAFVFALADFQRDDRQNLALRSNYGGGFGWNLVQSENLRLSVLGGLTYVSSRYSTEAAQLASGGRTGEALLGLGMDKALIGPLKFTSNLNVHPNVVEEVGRYRVNFDSGVQVPLFSIFTWNLRFYDRYDSLPPPDILRNDLGFIGSLGAKF